MYLFVSAMEPLVASEAVWSAAPPIDLCVAGPSDAARDAGLFACAGRPVRYVEEPLLAARRPDDDNVDFVARRADALRALYALDTRSALVVCDELPPNVRFPLLLDEAALLHAAEAIERHLPLP
jgi:hypothetical protein